MSISSGSGHGALRRGRSSDSGAEYFLTCCTAERQSGLESALVTDRILAIALSLAEEGRWLLRTAVVMTDHVHLFVVLGERETLSGALRLFKGRASPILRAANLSWQRGYFDHRLREDEDRLPIFLYIYLNPYRADLLKRDQQWPGFYCAPRDWAWFSLLTEEECPLPAWLL